MRIATLLTLCTIAAGCCTLCADDSDGFVSLFDGRTLNGWKVSEENPGSFSVEDGAIKAAGPRAHLFYDGPVADHNFKNFHLKARVMARPNSNSGLYFHTQYQAEAWPSKGYECQINNTHKDRKKTGGLYAIQDVMDNSPAKDNEWFDYDIIVTGKHIVLMIDGKKTVDYTEPDNPERPKGMADRLISSGTFAIQAHDPKSVVFVKDIRVKPLP
ncbi:DUF1080 domain-containing protein [Planctomycetales bacterium ZRK34]|nr:DUF1080 domain-containing protein [Planctomycetales bacterium ZRK34]